MIEANNIIKINGNNGIYDNKINNKSVRYGRNAANNYQTYAKNPIYNDKTIDKPLLEKEDLDSNTHTANTTKIENFIEENDNYLDSMPPLKFEYRYMPKNKEGIVDKDALLGVAYEEIGQKQSISVKSLEEKFLPNQEFTAKSLDINNDNNIDIGEYSASILASDIFSNSRIADIKNIDGKINQQGLMTVLTYAHKSNSEAAKKLYTELYNTYNLEESAKEFNPET